MTVANIHSVAIIGSGIAGWMSAALLATFLGPSVSITIVETELVDTCQTPITLPSLKAFHGLLGIDEAELLSRTQGTMKLGTQFVNWGALGNRYFLPHGGFAPDFDAVALHHWWLKARAEGASTTNLDDLSMAWGLAKESRFTHPAADRRLIHSTHDYAYHLDPSLYRAFLRGLALERGVTCAQPPFQSASLDPDNGHISHVTLANGDTVRGDIYLDCSGAQAVLIGRALQTEFEDWSSLLPCDRFLSLKCASHGELLPYTRITQREAGWQWRSQLQDQTSVGYVYSSSFQEDDSAMGMLMDNLDARTLGEPHLSNFKNGRRKQSQVKNVVAIGDAAGFLEPLHGTDLHLIQLALTRLLTLWPRMDFNPLLAAHFNKATDAEWGSARDFFLLHYLATERSDTPMWRAAKEAIPTSQLQARLDLWRSSARMILSRSDVFQLPSWVTVLIGQNISVSSWDSLADARESMVDYKARMEGIVRVISETAPNLPSHREWIEKNCKARN
jgi:tryptophan 7-halogenase